MKKILNKKIAKRIVNISIPVLIGYGWGVKLTKKAKVIFKNLGINTYNDPDCTQFKITPYGNRIRRKT